MEIVNTSNGIHYVVEGRAYRSIRDALIIESKFTIQSHINRLARICEDNDPARILSWAGEWIKLSAALGEQLLTKEIERKFNESFGG